MGKSIVLSKGSIIYCGDRVRICLDLILSRGKKFFFERVIIADSVAVLAVTENKEIVLVKQFRPSLDEETVDLPGGKVENHEDELAAAKRELREETGYEADKWSILTRFPIHSGRLTCRKTIFLAESLTAGCQELEPTENIAVELLLIGAALVNIKEGRLFEPSLQIALLQYILSEGR